MQKLLPAALLLASCTLPQVRAQQALATPSPVAATASSPTPALHWAAAEFCEAYAHYYSTLPSLYRYNASQALQHTPLAAPQAQVAPLLLQQPALREAVYQTIYQYCHTLKYGLNNRAEVTELVYQFLYRDLHMSDLAANYLTPQLLNRYQQLAPSSLNEEATLPASEQDELYNPPAAASKLDARALYRAPTRVLGATPTSDDLEATGWRLAAPPQVATVDAEGGVIRFRVRVGEDGTVKSVAKVSGNVSPAQELLCRDQLLNTHFTRTGSGAGGATAFYTYRFPVR